MLTHFPHICTGYRNRVMQFTPIEKMVERVRKNGDTDSALFHELLYAGEFTTKLTVLSLVASIDDDRENHRYQFLHSLVRSDGLGDWATTLDKICTGPAAQHIPNVLSDDYRMLTERVGNSDWQYKTVRHLQEVLVGVDPNAQPLAKKANLRMWFTKFVELRNKTRGHGAITPATCAQLVSPLQSSIQILIENNPMFRRPWAYLHRNLSGKYRVVALGGDSSRFAELKTLTAQNAEHYPDGVYLWVAEPRMVFLLHSDIDGTDFFVPNGAFDGKTYELHSLLTDDRQRGDASPYLAPPSARPPSETEGVGCLDVIGNVFSNLPAAPGGYVRRPSLEQEVQDTLIDDRHPIVTLVGRGGIGKTSLALAVLHGIANTDRYDTIVWFSARDIDLTQAGPKVVKPQILTEQEIEQEYSRLIDGSNYALVEDMRTPTNGAKLFVFDNFETVRNPMDLYQWIDANIRLPNKVVITTRFRDFKADFPIAISGMEYDEAEELIRQNIIHYGLAELVDQRQIEQIIEESDRHPYVIKIILGEIADGGTFSKPSKMLARKDDILEALFERTYDNLSPLAARIFLTLSGWRSLVPQLAVEAVLHWRSADSEGIDPKGAVDELVRMSLIERTVAGDDTDFLEVPIAAALFANRKLEVSQHYELIRHDVRFLQQIGSTKTTGLKSGSYPRIRSIFGKAASQITAKRVSMEEMRPVLEFIAQNYPRAWLLFADLEKEVSEDPEREAAYVRRFLEKYQDGEEAQRTWRRLIFLYRRMGDVIGSCSAFLKAADIESPDLNEVSSMAHYVNNDRQIIDKMDAGERSALFKPLAKLMEPHRQSASATDLSRLAWLYLHSGDEETALRTAEEGLLDEPSNGHCQRLVRRLT